VRFTISTGVANVVVMADDLIGDILAASMGLNPSDPEGVPPFLKEKALENCPKIAISREAPWLLGLPAWVT
jgi:hypothetical protein